MFFMGHFECVGGDGAGRTKKKKKTLTSTPFFGVGKKKDRVFIHKTHTHCTHRIHLFFLYNLCGEREAKKKKKMHVYALICVSSLIFGATCFLVGLCAGILMSKRAGSKEGDPWGSRHLPAGRRRYYAYDEEKAVGHFRRQDESSSSSDHEMDRKAEKRKTSKIAPPKKSSAR